MKKKNLKVPTIIGFIILVFAIVVGVLLVQSKQVFRLGASPDIAPKNVKISNVTDNSFSVSWTTEKEVAGVVKWGKTSASLEENEASELKNPGTVHYTNVRGLGSSSNYYFKINSGGVDYDNNDLSWSIKTGPNIGSPANSQTISGTVLTATGSPAAKVVVEISIIGSSSLSTTTSANGSWTTPLSALRNVDLTTYGDLDEKSVIEIFVQGGNLGISSAKVYLSSARPVPPIVLGQTHDFRDLPKSSETNDSPKAEINSPNEESSSYSKFSIPEKLSETGSGTVTLTNMDEGEIISTTTPEFFGEGPEGTEITIKLESQTPINDVMTIGANGEWNWSPPDNLEPGLHKITLSWKDENGILKTIVKNFVVSAAEGPAFEATPSASPSTLEATPSASPSSSASSSASPFPKPESGIGTTTTIFLTLGILLLTASSLAYSFAKDID